MGKINVVLDDGTVKTVDEEDYKRSRGQVASGSAETAAEGIARIAEERKRAAASGARGLATAVVTSALDTASFGLIGKAMAAYDPEGAAFAQTARQEHPTGNLVGAVAGFGIPGAAGIASAAGKAVEGATGLASAGRVAEGGLIGMGGHVAHTNVTGDPVSIEGLVTEFGVGAALNVGIGLVADKLKGARGAAKDLGPKGDLGWETVEGANPTPFAKAARARAKLDAAKEAELGFTKAERDYEVIDPDLTVAKKSATAQAREAAGQLKQLKQQLDQSPSYSALHDVYKETRAAVAKVNEGIKAEQEAYDAFASPKGAKKAIKEFEDVQARLREVATQPPAPALEAGPNNAVGGEGQEFSAAVKRGRRADRAKPAEGPTPNSGKDFPSKVKKGVGDHSAPIPGEVETGGDFSAAVKGSRQPVGLSPAPEESFAAKSGMTGPVDHAAPVSDNLQLNDVLKEMTAAKEAAKKAARAGDYEGMADTLEAMQEKVNRWLPKEKIEFPLRPLNKPYEVPPELPKTLSQIGKMRTDSIGRIAESLDDVGIQQLNQLAADLGFAPGATAADTLSELHNQIRSTLYLPARAASAADDVIMLTDEVIPLAEHELTAVDNAAPRIGDRMRIVNKDGELVPVSEATGQEGTVLGGNDATVNRMYQSKGEAWDAATAEVNAQRSLGGYKESEWSLPGAKAAKINKGSLLDTPIALAKQGAQQAAGRMADSALKGGAAGMFARVFAGHAVGGSLDAISTLVNGSALTAKVGLRAKISEAFARFARPVGAALDVFGPVTSTLKTQFPSGHYDDAEDERVMARNRINDIASAAVTAPDTLYSAVKSLMGSSGDIAAKMHQQWVNTLKYLAAVSPKDPGTNMTMNGSQWLPSYAEVDEFAHQYQAALYPDAYLARVIAGLGHPSGVETLALLTPAMLQEARDQALMEDWRGITAEGHAGLSMLFQRPMSALQDPDVFWLIQGQQLPPPVEEAQQNTRPPTGNPAGRPPAVSSKVAGSSVSALINQG